MAISIGKPNFVIEAADNGMQSIEVYDKRNKSNKKIITTPEKIDEFLTERDKAKHDAKKKGYKMMAGITAGGAIAGGLLLGMFGKKVGNIIRKTFKMAENDMKNAEREFNATRNGLWGLDNSTMGSVENVRSFFGGNNNSSKPKAEDFGSEDIGGAVAKVYTALSAISGALYAGVASALLSLPIPFVKAHNAGQTMDQKFIQENK